LTPAIAYVGLGSNLAHPRRQLARALVRLAKLPHTRVLAVSRNFVSAPIGATDPQPDYVNAVARLSTSLSPRALLARLLAIERRHGRRRPAGTLPNAVARVAASADARTGVRSAPTHRRRADDNDSRPWTRAASDS